jgi:hypothetical protein
MDTAYSIPPNPGSSPGNILPEDCPFQNKEVSS